MYLVLYIYIQLDHETSLVGKYSKKRHFWKSVLTRTSITKAGITKFTHSLTRDSGFLLYYLHTISLHVHKRLDELS